MGLSYDDLPRHDALGLPHTWGLLDPDLGSLSHLTEAGLIEATSRVERGVCVPLNLSLGEIDPPLFGRARMSHTIVEGPRNTFEEELDGWNPQSSSQWDGFRHVRAGRAGFYGGIADLDAVDPDRLSIECFARRGIAGRGVLLDVERWCRSQGRAWDPLGADLLDAGDLELVAAAQGLEVREGDILCIRLGWPAAYRRLDAQGRSDPQLSRRFAGLRAYEATARHLWDLGVAAVCADNPAIEGAPGSSVDGSLHRRLLPMLGIVMGELFDFETLAGYCAASGRYDFLFVAIPLPIPSGLSSPANAMAII